MMVSPETMKEAYEKMPYEGLVREREDLLANIKSFEAGDIDEAAAFLCPGSEVFYQMNLEYLGVLAPVIAEKYRMRRDELADEGSSEMYPGMGE